MAHLLKTMIPMVYITIPHEISSYFHPGEREHVLCRDVSIKHHGKVSSAKLTFLVCVYVLLTICAQEQFRPVSLNFPSDAIKPYLVFELSEVSVWPCTTIIVFEGLHSFCFTNDRVMQNVCLSILDKDKKFSQGWGTRLQTEVMGPLSSCCGTKVLCHR